MADDDNFDIDIYGDEAPEYVQESANHLSEEVQQNTAETYDGTADDSNYGQPPNEPETEPKPNPEEPDEIDYTADEIPQQVPEPQEPKQSQQQISSYLSTGEGNSSRTHVPKHAPRRQGVKREEGKEDSREVGAGATSALRLGDLQWWITEDDIRGWANQCETEDEIKEISFNEHKVNGKSKGEVFLELQTPQGATALKRCIESFGSGEAHSKKYTAIFVRPDYNPFKTHPKDAPNRSRDNFKERQQGAYAPNFNQGGGFRGGRGGFNNRGGGGGGGYNQGRGGYNNQHTGTMGGYGGMNNMNGVGMNQMGGYGGGMGVNRGGGMLGMNRGGFQGGRGGRGGMMNNNNMGMMPNMTMGNMGMGMGMGMGTMTMGNMGGMGMGMGNMGMGGYGQGQFNPQFFGGGGGGGSSQGSMSPNNPHGTKRQREG